MKRNIRLLYWHSFLTDFRPDWPYQIIFFSAIAGSYTAAMSVVALETLSAALFDIPTGVMSDRIGRRRTIAIGSFAAACGIGLYAAAHGPALLYLGAVLSGLSQCLFSGNNNALLFETLQSEGQRDRFAHYRAGIGMMYQAALCLSAFSATPLSGFGLRAVFIAATIPQLLAIPISLMFSEPKVELVEKQKSLAVFWQACVAMWGNKRLILMVLSRAITYGVGEARFKFQTVFIALVWPVWAVGFYRGINHSVVFCGFILSRKLIGRVKMFTLFIFHDIYLFVLPMIAALTKNTVSPILIIASDVMFGPNQVAGETLLQQEFTDAQRATLGSLASSASSLVFAITAVALGAMSDKFGVVPAVIFGICLNALCLPINIRLFRKNA